MTADEGHQQRPCWFVGAYYTTGDQTERFIRDGIWEMDRWDSPAYKGYVEQVQSMQPGDRIAIKAVYIRKKGIKFDNQGKPVSVMAIKAVGRITENPGDGHSVKVTWTPIDPPREWYFYTNRYTLWGAIPHAATVPWIVTALIEFTFENKPQDYKLFLEGPWSGRYSDPTWDNFIYRARKCLEAARHDEEIQRTLDIGQQYSSARGHVLQASDEWKDAIGHANRQKLLSPVNKARFSDWVSQDPETALRALQVLWSANDRPLARRISEFCEIFPTSVLGGASARTNVISFLLTGEDATKYPPYIKKAMTRACKQTGYRLPTERANEARLYEHALGFLDTFVKEARARGLPVRHRLDAQSIVRRILDVPGDARKIAMPPEFTDLATKLHFPADFLQNIETLLREKKQVIFQGPPGTGKTYVAQKLARHLAGGDECYQLVQFHPSYSYEDFVQGYRPTLLENGQPGFELKDGPFMRIARRAANDPNRQYFLIIDEINRGNLAKVFGEMYFLLEYRDEPMSLMYQDGNEPSFTMPDNLRIIGTMNTADRSIALVDLALRRRFAFVDFAADREPVRGLLRRWLKAKGLHGMTWVADVVDRANEKLGDRHAAIGPSYFMRENLDEEAVERIWQHNVLPYIEEHLFGESNQLDEFALDRLRRAGAAGNGTRGAGAAAPDDSSEDNAGD